MSTKKIQESVQLSLQSHGPGFQSAGINSRQLNLDPILNIDLFRMSTPTFPPHPHAGFSAVTYILPESVGSFNNRDSLGDQSIISPGSIHWTQAGSGLMHEEIPTQTGLEVLGFQIFVNLKREAKSHPPKIWHVDQKDVPTIKTASGLIRIVAGQYQGQASQLNALDTQVDFLDLEVYPNQSLSINLPPGIPYFVFGIKGHGSVAGQEFIQHQIVTLSPSEVHLELSASSSGLRLFIGGGKPINEDIVWGGPFAMNSVSEIQDARARFQRGEMGRLAPSF